MTFDIRTRLSAAAVAAIPLIAFCSSIASSHVSIDSAETKVGAFKAVFNIPHGCDGAATTGVKITIPEGVIGVKPMPKPGWTLTIQRGAYAKTYDHVHGRKVSEGAKSVAWSGGKLPNEHLDEFTLGLYVTSTLKPGSTIYFPVEQTCETGALAWSEIPSPGQDAHDLKAPAPGLLILADASGARSQPAGARDIIVGGLKIESPWLRATPGGAAVGAGYLKIVNAGSEADRLVGVAFSIAGRTEMHETTTADGVAKMRALPDGLEIKPGATVALAPGGAHLMLMDLKGPIVASAPVKGELTFEKAGKVEVEFSVAPVGATAPEASSPHHHH